MTSLGLGLPTGLAATDPDLLLAWIERAEAGPFTSVAVTDRVLADALEPMGVLALAAGVTRRVRLLASVVVGPTRETTLLARQAATIDTLSGGRLSLGLGVGARPDDHAAVGSDFHARGRTFDDQLPRLRAIWRGEGGSRPIGPTPVRPGGPEVLIGGYVEATVRRIAAWGDGYMAPGGAEPAAIARLWDRIREAWTEAGRAGSPRFLGGTYVALGPRADDAARAYVTDAYGADPALAARRLTGVPVTAQAVRDRIRAAGDMGMTELVLRPCAADLDQLDRIADLVAGLTGRSGAPPSPPGHPSPT